VTGDMKFNWLNGIEVIYCYPLNIMST